MTEENKTDGPKRERRKHFGVPEDYTHFDQQEFRRFTGLEITVGIIALALIIICIIQAVHFSNVR